MSIVLRRISAAAGEALRAGRIPEDVRVAADYPTEFSAGVGQHAGADGALGPIPGIERVIGHTPLDRPASGRVLEKAGFTNVGEEEDEHEGTRIRVNRWELIPRP